ncbi:T4S18 protein, partial [Eolophus roseicapillus]|nr:T4S18 protein [Eolophus roseicapilla]
MALETCGNCLSCLLIPLALWSIVVNILLYFPNGKASHAASYQLPNYVWYFEGICFSGVMVSLYFKTIKCILHSLLCITSISHLEIQKGELDFNIKGQMLNNVLQISLRHFSYERLGKKQLTLSQYLTDYPAWSRCTEPANIVEWNIILLSILIALSGLQLIICFLKVAAELKRTLCGTYSVFVQVTKY